MKHALWLPVLVCALFAHAPPREASASTSEPHTEGRLVTRRGGKVVDVPLEHTEVAIRVDGHLAEATVTQRFRNPYDAKIEAVYLFPLPTNAAVGGLTLTSGGRTIRGTIQERAKGGQRPLPRRFGWVQKNRNFFFAFLLTSPGSWKGKSTLMGLWSESRSLRQ